MARPESIDSWTLATMSLTLFGLYYVRTRNRDNANNLVDKILDNYNFAQLPDDIKALEGYHYWADERLYGKFRTGLLKCFGHDDNEQ